MITREPFIDIGIIERAQSIRGEFRGVFRTPGCSTIAGTFRVERMGKTVFVIDEHDAIMASGYEVVFRPEPKSSFLLHDVVIGINFHWERKEDQVFQGDLHLIADAEGITVVNRIGLEAYLGSVISSEMSASSPPELLRAHAITSRSWLAAMLSRRDAQSKETPKTEMNSDTEVVRWYGREDHLLFDVCADDHCQRYQGVSKMLSEEAQRAVDGTRGMFLVSGDEVCDARYYKACGGRTEEFRSAWEERDVPYLTSVADSEQVLPPIETEEEARAFIDSSPRAWCNTTDAGLLRSILPSFDQETTDFFRWEVVYTFSEISSLVRERSGIDFGEIQALQPVERGPSGRLFRLRIVGSKKTLIVGKELEIRKWLSKSHLYSSAFYIEKNEKKKTFTLVGAGWGHGVGLCQIGAAVMAAQGKKAEDIVKHYFTGAEVRRLY